MSAHKGERVRLTVRVPADLYSQLVVACITDGIAVNDLIVAILRERIDHARPKTRK